MKRNILFSLAAIALTVFAASADAAVRVAPVIKAPMTLPSIGMPVYPFPIERPTWPSLPMTLTLPAMPMGLVRAPAVAIGGGASLPAGVPANPLPVPAEKPAWPSMPAQVAFVGRERAPQVPQLPTTRSGDSGSGRQNIPEEAFDDLVGALRGSFSMAKGDKKPKPQALNAAFDGRRAEAPKAAVDTREIEDDGYVEPRVIRPTIGRVQRQNLPEDELLRDIGVQ